ncbi:hypothetical protein Srufu_053630 [Streptomyces libani subsp. rufus]|nr:hypothetical protein Srufu_053630 [Streptomyces libani subsp. rufus]
MLKRTVAPTTGAPPQVTVAVRVTGVPAGTGLGGAEVSVTTQLGGAVTVTVVVAETPMQVQVVEAPVTVAVTVVVPEGSKLVVVVAVPVAPVTPTPIGPAGVLKRTVAPTTGAPPQVTVAVKVTGVPTATGLGGAEVSVTTQLGGAVTVTVVVPETPTQVQVVVAAITVAVTVVVPGGSKLVVVVAAPVAPVTPTPIGPPGVVNRTSAPTTGAPPQVTVAVRVTGAPAATGLGGADVSVTTQFGPALTVSVAAATPLVVPVATTGPEVVAVKVADALPAPSAFTTTGSAAS